VKIKKKKKKKSNFLLAIVDRKAMCCKAVACYLESESTLTITELGD